MKSNQVKRKLAAGEPTFGTWLSLGDLYATRVLARLGFDWLTVDMEHSPIDWQQAAALFAVIAEAGCAPLARVPEGNHHYIKRALDAGAFGIIAPMVNTVAQAREVIAAAKYPPEGNRSVGGGLHALNFDATGSEYFAHANEEILVVLQTESPEGVEHAEAIYALPGCDAIFIGPNDLRAQMTTAVGGPPTPESHEAMIQRVIAAGQAVGTPTGLHVMSAEQALERVAQGMRFLAIGSDLKHLADRAHDIVSAVRPDSAAGKVAQY